MYYMFWVKYVYIQSLVIKTNSYNLQYCVLFAYMDGWKFPLPLFC